MKKSLVCFFLFLNIWASAQIPQSIPYQAVARNSVGQLIANQTISVRFTIHDNSAVGPIVYRETFAATTNAFGIFNLNIGAGVPVTGTFSTIQWGTNIKFLQVEMDPAGGSAYTDMGTQQMLSVPYALYSSRSTTTDALRKAKITFSVPPGTPAPVGTAGVWTNRLLNTIAYNDIGIVLSNNQIIIQPGTYEVSAWCTFNNMNFGIGQEKIRVLNVTLNSPIAISLNSAMSVAANYSNQTAMINSERFTLNAPSTISLQYFIDVSGLLGSPFAAPGQNEVYAEMVLTKIQ